MFVKLIDHKTRKDIWFNVDNIVKIGDVLSIVAPGDPPKACSYVTTVNQLNSSYVWGVADSVIAHIARNIDVKTTLIKPKLTKEPPT